MILYIAIGMAVVIVLLCVMAYDAKKKENPFHFPYLDVEFDVTGKHDPDIWAYIADWLDRGGWRQVEQHDAVIETWKRGQAVIAMNSGWFSDIRMEQYKNSFDDAGAYRFYLVRVRTRYRQRNYVKTPYKVKDREHGLGVSSQELRELKPKLFQHAAVAEAVFSETAVSVDKAMRDEHVAKAEMAYVDRQYEQQTGRNILSDHDIENVVKATSDTYKDLMRLRSEFGRIVIPVVPDVRWKCKSKGQYDRIQYDQIAAMSRMRYETGLIEAHRSWADLVTGYKMKVTPILNSYKAKSEPVMAYGATVSPVDYNWAEEKLCDGAVLKLPAEPALKITKYYVSAKGLSRLSETKIFTYAEAMEILKKDDARIEYEKTEKHRRKMERNRITDSVRFNVLSRDGYRCQICGREAADGVKLVVDHIKPIAKGGTSDMDNLWTLCETCNSGKSDKWEELTGVAEEPDEPVVQQSVQPVVPPAAIPAVPPVQNFGMNAGNMMLKKQ